MKQITDRDFNKIKRAVDKASDGLDEYAETLSDTWVCYRHLDEIYKILEKYEEK